MIRKYQTSSGDDGCPALVAAGDGGRLVTCGDRPQQDGFCVRHGRRSDDLQLPRNDQVQRR